MDQVLSTVIEHLNQEPGVLSCCCCLVTKSCPTFCNPMDCGLPGSSVHGILQVRTLEWVAIPFSRRSSRPRDQTQGFCIGRRILYHWATWEAHSHFTRVETEAWKHMHIQPVVVGPGLTSQSTNRSQQNCGKNLSCFYTSHELIS